jgi:hypothetical protein
VQLERRREEARLKREEKERLRALKENDDEAYYKLVDQTKNKRLKDLLTQTDNYLRRLGAMVAMEKDGEFDRFSEKADGRSKEGREQREKELAAQQSALQKRVDALDQEQAPEVGAARDAGYYTLAHTVEEEVTQPTNLVGGVLKEYQRSACSGWRRCARRISTAFWPTRWASARRSRRSRCVAYLARSAAAGPAPDRRAAVDDGELVVGV